MEHSKLISRLRSVVVRHSFILVALVVYTFSAFYYMGPSFTDCQNTTYGFGDNTAGPIWNSAIGNQGLVGNYTNMTNAPYGDNLQSPAGASFILQRGLIQVAQKMAGPVCGYNIFNIIGFVSSATIMSCFIRELLRRRWIAWFAGYATAFTPYYQMKVGGHPSYGFQALFIAIMWLFYRLVTYRKRRDAILLALVFVFSMYFDPYFTLFVALIMGSLVISWLIVNRHKLRMRNYHIGTADKSTSQQLRLIALSGGIILLGALPLVGVYVAQRATIEGSVAAARGNVVMEAKACSNWPHEYLVPFVLHPIFSRALGKETYTKDVDFLKDSFPCGIGEDTVGISIALITILIVGTIIVAWEIVNGRRLHLARNIHLNPRLVLVSAVLIGAVAVLMALPPVRYLGVVPTPSYELLQITPTWRTLTRFYMLVNIVTVTIVCIYLAMTWDRFKKYRKLLIALFLVLAMSVVVEYQSFRPFGGNKMSTYSYRTDAPKVYSWLAVQKNINLIAEYPLEQYGGESDAMSYYLTMQSTHKKQLFNSALPYGSQEKYKDSLKNLADPQTLPTLRAMGVDAVVTHGVQPWELSGAVGAPVVFTAPQATFNLANHSPVVKNDTSAVLDLRQVPPATYYLDLGDGFARNQLLINSIIDWRYEAINNSILEVRAIKNKRFASNSHPVEVCFSAQMSVPDEVTSLSVEADGRKIDLGLITGKEPTRYNVSAQSTIKLTTAIGHNLRISNLGCSSGE